MDRSFMTELERGEYTVEASFESESSAQKQDWHRGNKLREAVANFHLRYAGIPSRLDGAREGHTKLIERLLKYLRDQGIDVRPEYIGSAYEGVKVAKCEGNDDLEFDVTMCMKLPCEWKVLAEDIPKRAGHVFLSLPENYSPDQRKTFFDDIIKPEERYCWSASKLKYFLDGGKTINKFFGKLQSWINESWDIKGKILLRRHGPAIQMDVYEFRVNSDRPYYTVDVVPALEVDASGKKLIYVAKPIKSRIMPDQVTWRRLSTEETKFVGKYSDERVEKFTPTHLKYMLEIEERLRQINTGYRLRFAGHKIGTDDNNLEFRVLIIDGSKTNQIELTRIEGQPEFVRLNLMIGQTTNERISSRKETTSLKDTPQQFIMSSNLLKGKVHIRRVGPVVRLIVCESDEESYAVESFREKLLFYVDMILAYEVGETLYVARPREDWYTEEMENSKAWRLSFSTEAKELMYGPYGCLKMVFRVLKVLRNQEDAMAPLTSYHLKTVLLWLKQDLDSSAWNEKFLGERLMDALLKLEKYLKEKNFPHYFLPQVNLTSHMVNDCINSLCCRVHILCTKENVMMRVLHAIE